MIGTGEIKIPVQLMGGYFLIPVCTKRVWDKLRICKTDKDTAEVCGLLLGDVQLDMADKRLLVLAYSDSLEKIRTEAGLDVPYYPADADNDPEKWPEVKYTVYTQFDKMAADYAGMDLYQIDDVPVTDYWLLLRDAFISMLSGTKKGREYLNNAYRITQTEADKDINIGKAVRYEN